jgi:iron complex outermembrane receptor protein
VPLLDEQGVIATGADGEPLSRLPTAIFADLGGSPKKAANSVQGYTDRSIAGVSQRVDLRGDSVTLTSITAWRDIQFEWLEDSTGLPATTNSQTLSLMDDESHRQFSQELRWANDADARLAYVLGGYYLYEHTRRKETFPFQIVTAISDQTNTTDSVAVFGQLRYQLAKPLTLALGGRYTYDRKTISQTAINGGAPSIIFENFRSKNSADWEAFSPQLSLSLDAGNDLLLYGSISHGWKSGGFQGVPGTKQAAQQEVLPETALEYELGAKSDWFQHRLRINVAAFYTNYRNLQVVQFQTIDDFGLFQTSNAASANVSGVEIESWAQLSRHWSMSGTYAYLNARYDTFIDLQGRDFSSSFLRQSPEHSASVALEYRRPVSLGTMRLRMDYRYQSDSYREPDNSIGIMPAYSLMDASAHLQGADQRWELSVWAKNLRDEQYISHLYLLGGNDYALYGTPRQFGVSLSWRLL